MASHRVTGGQEGSSGGDLDADGRVRPLLNLDLRLSQQSAATDDLIHALNDTHSAIASSLLAIELYDQQ